MYLSLYSPLIKVVNGMTRPSTLSFGRIAPRRY